MEAKAQTAVKELEIAPNIPEPKYVIEFGKVYYQAIYRCNEEAKKFIEKFNDYKTDEDNEETYLCIFKAAAFDVAQSIDKIEREYNVKKARLDTYRDNRITTETEIFTSELEYLKGTVETSKSIVERAIPAVTAWALARTYIPTEFLPEAVAGITFIASHLLIRRYGKDKKKELRRAYDQLIDNINEEYISSYKHLREEVDTRKLKVYSIVERKLAEAYQVHIGIDVLEEPSSERFNGLAKIIEAEHMEEVLEAVKTSSKIKV
ncbi:MAG: hypothetical protein ACE5J4_02425 [Candidatus Aenigmatarchaeota archaeon]